ncbi:response regulator [Mangrovibacterium lignilyticum]|uniref:response regulator n=1 Tax=Mangrovibacterium lignilyticum TaxID=2668052 RepID=UPI0013D6A673|nr:response regulator [Mangrovibacterium lignilyticum]
MSVEQDFSNLKLLVVDDSPINHRVVTLSLRGRFKEIESAYNGLEAFEKYKEVPYDVILMDAMMPVMNGCESTLVIRMFEKEQQFDKKSFIIAMTASDANGDIKHCLDAGMDAYIGKPFIAANFLRMVEEKFKPLA